MEPSADSLVRSIAYQGEPGAFSEEAIIQEFGDAVRPIPFRSLGEVFESVKRNKADSAVVPVENSLEGSVNETYDLLLHSGLKITGEVRLRVRHSLISKPSSSLDDIRTVYSHPQALAQCRRTLTKLRLELRPFYDTAGSVKFVTESPDDSVAAVASSRAASIYSGKILLKDVEDSRTNFTRFLVLGRKPRSYVSGPAKTSLIFSTANRPGALYGALEAFAKQKINLTRIESRPTKHVPWEYYFYVDFEGKIWDDPVGKALAALGKRVNLVRILGSYPQGRRYHFKDLEGHGKKGVNSYIQNQRSE